MKCDMHVHSYFSGPCTTPPASAFCRESYSDPEEVFEALERHDMNLFTLTDHDSIEGSERLRHYANFFLSEELTCQMPSGTRIHIGVYDLQERDHVRIQHRRNDLPALLMYLSERQLFFSVNHVFSSLTGRREHEDFDWFAQYFPAVETRNGQMSAKANAHAARLARCWRKAGTGGSDAHALRSVGTTYTQVHGARSKQEFFDGLKDGRGRVRGESGCYTKLTRDVFLIALEMMREKPWTVLLAPLAVAVPAFTYWNYREERAFVRRWSAEVFGQSAGQHRIPSASIPNAAEEWG